MKNVFTLLLLTFCLQLSSQNIQRVEPANWWTGMQWNELQLLVYGTNISELKVKVENDNLKLKRIVTTKNPNYLFLYVSIPANAKAGLVPIQFYNGKKLIKTFDFELKARAQDAAYVEGFTPEDVIYLITPDRFANGDPSNDEFDAMEDKLNRSEKFGRHGGDIKGIQDNLEYIKDLGFTAIWLNPIIENDMPAYSYHGYAATDFYKVDQRFGTNEEYVKLITDCRKNGVKVIMDMIVNHCGSSHWFVLDPPTDDWINNQNNFVQTTHKRQTVQDIHASEYDKKAFSDGWFVKSMPDMNQKNELMADYLIQNTLWWIEYSGISGIRMDTYPYPDKDFMSDWTCAVMDEYPYFSIVGEEWSVNPAIVAYWQGGKENHDGYASCLPSLMDFPLQYALGEGLTEEEDWNKGLIKMYEMLANDFLYSDPDNLVIFPDNHDMDRFFTQVNHDMDLFKMGLVYVATMRGIPQLYYGTEIAMDNEGYPGDHGIIRTDFPGGWEGDAVNAFTNENLPKEKKEIKRFTKKLLNWRKTAEPVHFGKLMQFAPEKGVYSYIRHYKGEKVLVLFNKNTEETSIRFDKYAELLQGDTKGYEVMSETAVDMTKPFKLQPNMAYIIEL
ncbi:MAG: glycoside hydrolase family 13 protein [Saprospiraceae bacterium]|nr:glycoside hydrolase family 13 protein [Saprospiraceae bacterium]